MQYIDLVFMTDIKVILESGRVNVHSLSQEERDVLFDQLSLENDAIPKSTFDNFSDMVTESIRQELMANKPELKELLLRRIITMGSRGQLNTLVVPIIQSLKTGGRDTVGHRDTVDRRDISGGATIRKFKPIAVHTITSPDAINVRFDTRVLAVTIDGLEYIAPPNEELGIIGVVVNPRCAIAKTLGANGKLVKLQSTRAYINTIADRLLIGNYEYIDASHACDGYFKTLDDKTQSRIYMFSDGVEILDTLFSYLHTWQAFITSQAAAQYIHAQLENITDRVDSSTRTSISKLAKLFAHARVVKIPVEKPSVDKTPLMKLLESIANISFDTRYNSWIADMYGRGFAIAYTRSILKGIDHPSTLEQIDIYKSRKQRIDFQIRVRDKLLNDKNTLSIYRVIIEKKLGAARANQIEQKAPQTLPALLLLLKPAEVKTVEMEFTRRDKYITAWMNNKCAHVKVYRGFRNSFSNEHANTKFNELKKFFKPTSARDSMIQCNVCGFDIICPHIRELTELELMGKNYSDIKAKLTKYIDSAHVKDQYYCKICGELISSLEAFGDVSGVVTATHMDEELKNFIWGEVAITMKYLKFAAMVNVSSLITATRDAIYPFIFEIEKQILKSKTNTVDEIKAKKRLFITIYTFAYLLRVVAKHRNVEFKGFKARGKNPLIDLIKFVIDLISVSRNIIIREIPGMTIDIIKNKLIEAYKSLQEATTTVITHGQTEDLVNSLMLDPVYKYLYTMTILDEILHGKTPKRGRMDMVDRIDSIMGESIPKLEKSTDVFKYANVPKFTWNRGDKLKKLVGAVRSLEKYNDGLKYYTVRSFELFMSALRRRLYIEPMYIDVSSDRKTMMIDARFRDPHEKYMHEFQELHASEIILLKYRDMYYAKNFTTFSKGGSRRYIHQTTKLGRVYDENGISHSWGIYIYVDGAPVEVKTSEIIAMTESGKQFKHKIIDKKCLRCGVKWSDVDKLDDTKIRAALDIRYSLGNFYRFYENRCPIGGLHEYANVAAGAGAPTCKKCGYVGTDISIDFYNKHASAYARERDEFAIKDIASTYVNKPPADLSRYKDDYATWTPNFNTILELANAVKINHRLLSALGAVEKIEYVDVTNGNYIPPEAENRNDTRIYVLVTHVKNLFTEWNQIRFFHRLIRPPADLSALIDSSGINKHKLNELGKKLPDIYDEFNTRFAYVQRNKKPREIVAFCIETFCLLCLKLWNEPGVPETEKLRRGFVDYFVKKVLRGEEMLTKPGYFSWSLLYGEKEVKTKESFDSNYADSVERAPNDDADEIENFGETNEPLTLDAIDVEADPDAEPDDDPSNEIRVEGYGLD